MGITGTPPSVWLFAFLMNIKISPSEKEFWGSLVLRNGLEAYS
jgi:hypothetical protein